MQSHYNSEDFALFNLDDVDAVFDHMTKLKYSQTYQLQGGQQALPHPQAHTTLDSDHQQLASTVCV